MSPFPGNEEWLVALRWQSVWKTACGDRHRVLVAGAICKKRGTRTSFSTTRTHAKSSSTLNVSTSSPTGMRDALRWINIACRKKGGCFTSESFPRMISLLDRWMVRTDPQNVPLEVALLRLLWIGSLDAEYRDTDDVQIRSLKIHRRSKIIDNLDICSVLYG